MEDLQSRIDTSSIEQFIQLKDQMASLLVQEDCYWKQRAKAHWSGDGDANTKFFHATATARKKINKLENLVDNDRNVVEGQQQLNALAHNYFQEIFTAKVCSFKEVVNLVPWKLNDGDNESLTVPFTEEEFHIATFQMHPDKSPDPDGLNPAFYQYFWSMCGKDVFQACSQWLSQGIIPDYICDTNIVLIPKCDRPSSMRDLMPISLCNVSYKILAKVLSTRLSRVIDKCIS